jgi:hypothetical protein
MVFKVKKIYISTFLLYCTLNFLYEKNVVIIITRLVWVTFSASRSARAPESRGARAVDLVVGNFAFCWIIARIFDGARVLATFVDASAVRRAIRVGPTLDGGAGDVRVALQPDGAGADGLVTDAWTFGVAAAGQVVDTAHGGAVAAAASVGLLTFAVRLAADLKWNNLSWLRRFFCSFHCSLILVFSGLNLFYRTLFKLISKWDCV